MVTFHIQTCRHGIEISQICDKCVALSDAPQPQSDLTDLSTTRRTTPSTPAA